ncbi:hypothetical protein [Glycomyces paridis]|uniref:WXG100 family type VII secretion target n=1 Tax=Glycomyces paridis TaxID=2126555 RepID=A0A4S8PB98_9ACTN|nr:hypothetical protein [Glycomyces paridis]THV27560.1 hypothetical protein E9998_14200 [Glycomyces paridis]
MAGADVFTMEPDEVRRSVDVLFEIEAEVDRQTATMAGANADACGPLKDAGTALGPALEAAGEWWQTHRAGGFTGLLGNTGEYLAVCTEEAVEIDDYNAGTFASVAGDLYPTRPNANASSRPDW